VVEQPRSVAFIQNPDIALDGHRTAQEDYISRPLNNHPSSAPDVMIIMGTSMKVPGLQRIVEDLAKAADAHNPTRVILANCSRVA
jgi:NAD-dependent SIR2 family protein deacetylase